MYQEDRFGLVGSAGQDRTQSYSDDPEYQDDDESDKSLRGHETSILAGADQSTLGMCNYVDRIDSKNRNR